MLDNKPFLSIKEAAELLGVSTGFIYREAAKPGFTASRRVPKGKLFINREKFLKWMER